MGGLHDLWNAVAFSRTRHHDDLLQVRRANADMERPVVSVEIEPIVRRPCDDEPSNLGRRQARDPDIHRLTEPRTDEGAVSTALMTRVLIQPRRNPGSNVAQEFGAGEPVGDLRQPKLVCDDVEDVATEALDRREGRLLPGRVGNSQSSRGLAGFAHIAI